MGKWFRLPGSQLVAEKRFAWHASRELLELYKRIQLEDPRPQHRVRGGQFMDAVFTPEPGQYCTPVYGLRARVSRENPAHYTWKQVGNKVGD
jgi:hypothetical protein